MSLVCLANLVLLSLTLVSVLYIIYIYYSVFQPCNLHYWLEFTSRKTLLV